MCHKGHDISFEGISDFYCDCGDKRDEHVPMACQLRKGKEKCTYELAQKPIEQKTFRCVTCGSEDGLQLGLCEWCAQRCHAGHTLRVDQPTSFACCCGGSVLLRNCTLFPEPSLDLEWNTVEQAKENLTKVKKQK